MVQTPSRSLVLLYRKQSLQVGMRDDRDQDLLEVAIRAGHIGSLPGYISGTGGSFAGLGPVPAGEKPLTAPVIYPELHRVKK
jgi:hypothetical protein